MKILIGHFLVDDNIWDDIMNVNVKMLSYKAAANQMVKQQESDKTNDIKTHYPIISLCVVRYICGSSRAGAVSW